MEKKDLENLEEKLDGIYQLLSHQNSLLSEIKGKLAEITWIPIYLIGGAIGIFLVVEAYNFLFGY